MDKMTMRSSGNIAGAIAVITILISVVHYLWGQDIEESENAIEQWGPATEGYQLSIEPEKEVFAYCEPIVLRVQIKNVGGERVHYGQPPADRYFIAVVKNAKGEIVPLTAYGKHVRDSVVGLMERPVKLDPGQKDESYFLVNRIYDMTRRSRYSITVKCRVYKRTGKGSAEVESNRIEVAVKGHPPNPFDDEKGK